MSPFQSHNGAIAAFVDFVGLLHDFLFQSHNGAIAARYGYGAMAI